MPVTLTEGSQEALCGAVPRQDAGDKVRGAAVYVADIHRPNMLHGKAVRSPHAHALVKAIDATAALALPGVVAVLTAADIPGINITGARTVKDQPVLAEGRVRFAGEAVAVVAAESEEIAARGAKLVRVEYEPLPVVDDPAGRWSREARWWTTRATCAARSTSSKGTWPRPCARPTWW